MSRPAVAQISLSAFRHNYQVAKKLHGGKSLAVIKANAYGHGAVQCALAIHEEADGFAVACIEEALALREAGITRPILLLEGFFEGRELPEIVANNFWTVIHHRWQAQALMTAELAQPVHVWLKLDSGMHRAGLTPEEYADIARNLDAHRNVASITMMTHFANADQLHNQHTNEQLVLFNRVRAETKSLTKMQGASLANSSGILGWPTTSANWSRPGIMLYGANPLPDQASSALKPVMQLTSRIISTRQIAKGEAIGYGSIFTAERDSTIGVVACGYTDGYPRLASGPSPFHNKHQPHTPAAVNGYLTRVIGRVSMDMLYVDLTNLPMTGVGSQVELWGAQIPVNDVASAAGTIAYELLCNVKRVAFRYIDN